MTIANGQVISASDFISTSAGAGDSGKVPKLNGSGVLDDSFLDIETDDIPVGIFTTNFTTGTAVTVNTETEVYSVSLPAILFSTTSALKIKHTGSFTSEGSFARNTTINFKFNGTTIASFTNSLIATTRDIFFELDIFNNASLSSQFIYKKMMSPSSTTSDYSISTGTSTIDTTSGVTFSITYDHLWTSSAGSCSAQPKSCIIEKTSA